VLELGGEALGKGGKEAPLLTQQRDAGLGVAEALAGDLGQVLVGRIRWA
jgi:hypothetical protein